MKKLLIISSIFIVFVGACKTDFDINAPYKETMVIYGFLCLTDTVQNATDSIQYIRISKAYLGEGNALIMAQQRDSINYADILQVRLERILNGGVMESFLLTRVDTIPKDPGIFASPYQVYYATSHPIYADGSSYRLTVTNTQTGTVATSTTKIVGNINVQHPTSFSTDADFATPYPYTVDFDPGANSKVFDLVIRFHYREIDASGNSSFHSVDWNFPDQLAAENPNATIGFHLFRPDFFQVLASAIPVQAGVTRRVDSLPRGIEPVEFRFIAATEDLLTYQQLLIPSTGVVQERPLFTTVNNGIGIFTSRLIRSVYRNLNVQTKAAFDTSAYTHNLNFQF